MNREPIAIVGIGCRFPGAKNPEAFWQLLRDGVDAITEVPAQRWDVESFYDPESAAPDKMNTRWGGFLEEVDKFDPQFFGIAPREAVSIDPQQRLLLEVAWEALEDAGQVPERLAGTRTGVFIGISTHDYSVLLWGNPTNDPYATTGTGNCIAANRISYLFNFQGPSLAVDTACSSSLVAVHLACQSLWSRESTLALAGGVQVILLPRVTASLSKAGFMAPDGRCKTFDARANGYVRSEGVGVLVLKLLSQALTDGDPIYAVIRGSAVNQDGRSNGLSAPNPRAQEAVLREAYRQAGVSPGKVQYVEAHGTATKLGDPIEMKSLGAVLAEDRPAGNYCTVGSVKTNIGHAESAAGIASLIKVALSLKHRQIPPSLHFQEPNPYIHFERLPLRVQQTLGPWTESSGPALAGVSSFSFGGTNAHVVLEEVPVQIPATSEVDRPLHLLTLRAKSENALQELARRYEEFLDNHPTASIADICFTANTGRSPFSYRLAVIAESNMQLREQLKAFATSKQTTGITTGQAQSRNCPKIAFLFTGQGSQYLNMGRQLYETQPTFRKTLQLCDEVLRPYLEQPLLSVLYPASDDPLVLNETAYTQPALFALEYALAQLWRSWGVVPDVVMGHSLGEYIAACMAGVFTLEDGLKLIAARSRLMQNLPSEGEMIVVFASELRVAAAIQPYSQEVAIAAINGPENTVISGECQSVQAVIAALQAEGIKTRKLQVSHAFHSPLMEPMLAAFEQIAREVTYSSPRISLISNVSGNLATAEIATPEYWCRHIRQPVRFASGMETLYQQGYGVFVEIGPEPILLGMGCHCLPEGVGAWLPSLRQGQQDWQQALSSLGELYVQGVGVDWFAFDRDYLRYRVQLPTYPWQRSRYWLEKAQEKQLDTKSEALLLWESTVSSGHYQAQQCPLDLALHTYSVKERCLERLTTACVIEALTNFGVYTQTGERHSVNSLLHQFKISSTYSKLLFRWLKKLAGFGLLKQQEEEIFVCDHPLPTSKMDSVFSEARELFTDTPFLLDYLQRCGNHLTAILTGKHSPLETLFPGGSLDTAENLYQEWSVARYFNAIARSITESVVKVLPPGKQLRILEIGAGTGGTTTSLLPVLPPERTFYYFTDLSDFFFVRAKQKFKAYPFVHYGLLDIEQNPQNAGYEYKSFDVVVATNVLHATRNLGETLEHVLSLLAPGGLLLLNEVTHHASWFDISTGLIEGWQGFNDPLRQDNPLLSHKQWEEALRDRGFEKVVAFPEPGSTAEVLGQHILVAQSPVYVAHPEGRTTPAVADQSLVCEPTREFFPAPVVQKPDPSLTREELLAADPEERQQLLESYLGEQVARVLGFSTSKLDIERSLKDMGLDSLMAVALKNQIEINLGVVVPTANFFQVLSFSQLTTQVLEQLTAITSTSKASKGPVLETAVKHSGSLSRSLIEIQPAGSKLPFVCVHPGGLDVSCYANLARHLANEQPFYALQLLELDDYRSVDEELLFSSYIQDTAARCIEALHGFQPQGPYLLGGWSLGGCVAFEIAQQLQKQGHKVALLALLDVINLPIDDDSTLVSWFASYLGTRRNKELPLNYDDLRRLELNEQLSYVLKQAVIADVVPFNTDLAEIWHLFQVYKTGVQISLRQVENYKLQIYPNRITLFQASEVLNGLNGVVRKPSLDRRNWSNFSTEPLEFHVVPGNHYTMLIEPHVQILAEELKRCLERVEPDEK